MRHHFFSVSLFFLSFCTTIYAQQQKHAITSIGFYNLENLFDCIDDPLTFDEDYTPTGKNQWNEKKLKTKLDHIAEVIANIGVKTTKKPPAILGVAEVENRDVLEQLVDHPLLQKSDYGIAHYNSPDRRGIDVALLYDRAVFTLTHAQKHHLFLKNEFNKTIHTRDQLCVSGYLGDELLYIIVNHWPSRRGGQQRSEPKRIEAAQLCKRITDSIQHITPKASIVIMGDFNDDPNDKSFKKKLKTKATITHSSPYYLYNPMEKMHKKGMGSLAYRDKWNLFDQLIVSSTLLDSVGFKLYKTHIFNPKFLMHTKGKYKGYPLRTYSRGIYTGGYSDHFPVYMYLVRPIH
ncbi:endonuclease/exonuclease/phosphatase family protein [Aquimarina agarilytica]|uniref:endonuclease/exonuclease/phosphatase family protein n=1 Tax=Aquimarina agarilytica TaxID=1087449 RepID=UPI00028A3613|nr:endonuclease [Aquimarina agarilytica]